jgi:hypothetical protein
VSVEGGAAAGVGGSAATVAPYIGVAAAVPHRGSNLPSWPTPSAALTAVAHGGRLPRGPTPRRGPLAPPLPPWAMAVSLRTVVTHGGWLSNLQKIQTTV